MTKNLLSGAALTERSYRFTLNLFSFWAVKRAVFDNKITQESLGFL